MTSATTAFFDDLARRGHERALEGARGTLRIELVENGHRERWLVSIDHGDVRVSHRNVTADATLRTDRATFAALLDGRANALASVFRGTIDVDGDWGLLLQFQRLFPCFPAPPESAP